MIAVIFEVLPNKYRFQEYLGIAADLRPELEKMDSFSSIERFSSLVNGGKILSLSFWRDEQSVKQWRNHMDHQVAQSKGRNGVFQEYRLRVADIIRDYTQTERVEAPQA